MILEYTLAIGVSKYEDPLNELFYDELRMVTSTKVEAKDDIVYFTFLKNKLEIDNKYGQRNLPLRNKMNINQNEYREFISQFGFFMNYMKNYLNDDYFKNGIRFPYNP